MNVLTHVVRAFRVWVGTDEGCGPVTAAVLAAPVRDATLAVALVGVFSATVVAVGVARGLPWLWAPNAGVSAAAGLVLAWRAGRSVGTR